MTSRQTVAEQPVAHTSIAASRREASESLPDVDQAPLAHDLGAPAASAVRVGFGALVTFWGVETLTPAASVFVLSSGEGSVDPWWFTFAVGALLVTSGAMTITNKLVPLAMTFLVPLSLHALFQWAHI
jgi:hypothetical protein